MATINTKFLTIDGLKFAIGGINDVVSHIIYQSKRSTKGCVILPCSLNDLAHKNKTEYNQKAYTEVDMLLPDGMPLVWAISLKGKKTDRIYGPDLMKRLLSLQEVQRTRHVFYGSSKRTLNKLEMYIQKKHPYMKHTLFISPPFRQLSQQEEWGYVTQIRHYKPDYVWIGLSSPKQVIVAVQWKNQLPNTIILCVGAAFDFIAGTVPQAPKWMQRMGLEWAFRLGTNPRRLWRRYLVTIPSYLLSGSLFKA